MCLLFVFVFYRGWWRYFCVFNCCILVMCIVCREFVNIKRLVGVWNFSFFLVFNLLGIRMIRWKFISNLNWYICCVIEIDKFFFDCVGSIKGIKIYRGYMLKLGLMRVYGERIEVLIMLGMLWCMMWRCSSGFISWFVWFLV